MIESQYLLLRRNYPSILDYDSWLDCSDIFELSKDKISERNARLKGSLIEDDKERVFNILRETDMIDNITKRRFGII